MRNRPKRAATSASRGTIRPCPSTTTRRTPTPRRTSNIAYLTNTGFTYYDQDLNLINNDQFGTCEIVSLDPLTVKYTVNEGVKWSDGVQIGAADMVLSWARAEREFQRRRGADSTTKAICCRRPACAFDKVDPSLALITDFPTIGDDGRSATFVWS